MNKISKGRIQFVFCRSGTPLRGISRFKPKRKLEMFGQSEYFQSGTVWSSFLVEILYFRLLRIALSEVDRQNFVNSCRRLCTSPYTFPKTLLVKVRANWRCCHSRSTIASWTNVLAFEAIEQLRKWCSTRKKQKISNKPTNFHFFILWCENEIFK